MTDVEERLAQIRALHVETQVGYGPYDSLCEVCREAGGPWPCATAAVLDAAPVAATPPQGIDRDALAWAISDVLMRVYDNGTSPNARREAEEVVKVVLALVRPVEGVVLTPQEAALCVGGLRLIERQGALPQTRDAARTLAARLEADPGRELGGRSSA